MSDRYNPAYAGTTYTTLKRLFDVPIQPRVCGDYAGGTGSAKRVPDTTPRMRGLHRYL